jgi:hypothetical protein
MQRGSPISGLIKGYAYSSRPATPQDTRTMPKPGSVEAPLGARYGLACMQRNATDATPPIHDPVSCGETGVGVSPRGGQGVVPRFFTMAGAWRHVREEDILHMLQPPRAD